jgi:2-polyprenyl-3-methyl-5-hydroxy-6-metoxy-1,4-benzoquinol methylase
MDINKTSYNKITEKWADSKSKSSPGKFITDVSSKIKPNGKILDIGCGTGYPIAKYFSDNGFSVIGIDISENMIKKAVAQKIKNATFYLCDFFEYNPTEKYDGIIGYDSFFHFPKEKQREIYLKISNWINIGGYLLFTHGNKDGEIEGNMFGERFYYSALDTKEVHRLLLEYGFEIEMSIEKYKEENLDIDLIVMAKKVK